MSQIFHLEGFPTLEIGERLELPSIVEMLRIPQFIRASADDAYKHGGEFVRYLLDKTPLKNSKKYVVVNVRLHYLMRDLCPITTMNWHCDGYGASHLSDDVHHIMIHESSSLMTEFFAEPVDWELDDDIDLEKMMHIQFRQYLTHQADQLGIVPKCIEPNRMVTFGCRHPHRARAPQRPEFRLTWLITESTYHTPLPYEQAFMKFSRHSYKSTETKDGELRYNIEFGDRGIIIHDKQ